MKDKTVRDVMSPDVITVRDQMNAEQLAACFEDNDISGAPVVDDDGRLVGVVSLKDLVRSVVASGAAVPDRSDPSYFLRDWEDRFNPEDVRQLRVFDAEVSAGELMSPVILTVTEDTSAAACARKMMDHRVHRLLVTRGEELIGIVTSFDLLGLVAEAE